MKNKIIFNFIAISIFFIFILILPIYGPYKIIVDLFDLNVTKTFFTNRGTESKLILDTLNSNNLQIFVFYFGNSIIFLTLFLILQIGFYFIFKNKKSDLNFFSFLHPEMISLYENNDMESYVIVSYIFLMMISFTFFAISTLSGLVYFIDSFKNDTLSNIIFVLSLSLIAFFAIFYKRKDENIN